MPINDYLPKWLIQPVAQEAAELKELFVSTSVKNTSRNTQYKVIRCATALLAVYAVYSLASHVLSIMMYLMAYATLKKVANTFYANESKNVIEVALRSDFYTKICVLFNFNVTTEENSG